MIVTCNKLRSNISVTIRKNYAASVSNKIVIVYIVEMKTPSNIPLLTANFQKLSSEELFNGSVTLIILNTCLLEKLYLAFFPPLQLQTKLCQENSIIPCCIICAITYTPANSTIAQLLSLILSLN